MRRQRYRQRREGGGNLILLGILILAVATGYAGTKYVIAPYVLGDGMSLVVGTAEGTGQTENQDKTQENKEAPVSSGSGIVSGGQEIKNVTDGTKTTAGTEGTASATGGAVSTPQPAVSSGNSQTADAFSGKYAVQFGSFSTQSAAETAAAELAAKNIAASVLEKGATFKVVGAPFDTKEKALAEAVRLQPTVGDVYVAGF